MIYLNQAGSRLKVKLRLVCSEFARVFLVLTAEQSRHSVDSYLNALLRRYLQGRIPMVHVPYKDTLSSAVFSSAEAQLLVRVHFIRSLTLDYIKKWEQTTERAQG